MRRKERNYMIKHFICGLLLLAVLFCVGCGTEMKDEEVSDKPATEQSEMIENTEEGVISEITENAEGSANSEDVESTGESANSEDVGTTGENVNSEDVGSEETGVSTGDSEQIEESDKYQFPLMLDSDKLELSSVFEFSGINPDCGDEYSDEIGAIQVKNLSGEYLESLTVKVLMSDGKQLNFLAEDVPTDMEVLAFELQNQPYDDGLRIEDIQAEAKYSSGASDEEFTFEVSGSEITVENISGEKKENVVLHYHCSIDGMLFGGKSYEQTMGVLEAGESQKVTDSFCYMGDVTVVNVSHE